MEALSLQKTHQRWLQMTAGGSIVSCKEQGLSQSLRSGWNNGEHTLSTRSSYCHGYWLLPPLSSCVFPCPLLLHLFVLPVYSYFVCIVLFSPSPALRSHSHLCVVKLITGRRALNVIWRRWSIQFGLFFFFSQSIQRDQDKIGHGAVGPPDRRIII